ncbi:MAG: NAD(P)/FAD-dependent oxidoreductase [Candidatus Omnitrophica bacterium]|nr:NAD(P)/FAD-dependent oxidoreductase [Candidatus Omnitrophota bacterium]
MPNIKVVIAGAGFGGLGAVKKLAKNKKIEITLIDKTNHHLFQPLLYQVASAALGPTDIAIPTRMLTTAMKNVTVLMGEVSGIDKDNKVLFCRCGRALKYDYLILALGAITNYYGNDHWEKYSTGLKSITDAIRIRNRLLLSFEKAEVEGIGGHNASDALSFVIIGGGPTGVELSGAIAELSHRIIRKDFRRIDPALSLITLIEAGPRLLPSFSPVSSEIARTQLEKRGVDVLLSAKVQDIDGKGVRLADKCIASKNIIWTAGVRANPFGAELKVPLDNKGRVRVNEYCSLPGYPEIFIIGDMASFGADTRKPLPEVSPVAMQQGRYAAGTILDMAGNKKILPFKYVDKGSMATIGRNDAVAEIKDIHLSGFTGWVTWLAVHLFYQVGFKNKIAILITWVWSYLTNRAAARLIQPPVEDVPAGE